MGKKVNYQLIKQPIKASFVSLLGLILLTTPLATAQAASLTDLQNQLNKAQDDLTKFQQLKTNTDNQVTSYQQNQQQLADAISKLKASIQDLENQIGQKQGDIDTTTQSIEQKTTEIDGSNQNLNNLLATLYKLTNLTGVEAMSNQNISDANTRAEYMQSIQSQVISQIADMNKVKQDLEATKSLLQTQEQQLAALKGSKVSQANKLNSQQQQVAQALNQAKANQAAYQANIQKLKSQTQTLGQQIYDLRIALAKKSNEHITLSGSLGYPYNGVDGVNKGLSDDWGFLKGQCTSYAAWKWNSLGHPFYDIGFAGNAYNWPNLATSQGYSTSSTPKVGDIVSWAANSSMPYGHVAYVEAVNSDGTIDVSEANWSVRNYVDYRTHVAYWQYTKATFIQP